MPGIYFVGVDVGTGSARAALVNAHGRVQQMHVKAIQTWNPLADHYEQSSEDIWNAVCECVRVSGKTPNFCSSYRRTCVPLFTFWNFVCLRAVICRQWHKGIHNMKLLVLVSMRRARWLPLMPIIIHWQSAQRVSWPIKLRYFIGIRCHNLR